MLILLGVTLLGAHAVYAGTPSTAYAFVTTQKGTGNLGGWSEAAGHTGTAAGDAICQTEAAAAALPAAQNYIAFLSDSNDDLYCRLHGLHGKRSGNCGQSTLPAFAGPWLRLDGTPFATIALVRDEDMSITPVLFGADGAERLSSPIYTGSTSGAVAGETCGDWSSATATQSGQYVPDRTLFYAGLGGAPCSNNMSALLCLLPGPAAVLNYARRSGRYAFVTQAMSDGDLSRWPEAGGQHGPDAADQICRSEAASNGLEAPQSYKAWLSDSTQSPALDARSRFANDGPWVRADGIEIAASLAALTDPTFSGIHSLPQQIGTPLSASGYFVLTGTNNDGTAYGSNFDCLGGTSANRADQGIAGYSGGIEGWTASYHFTCDYPMSHLYCFSDLDRIFGSDFESVPY